MVLNYKLGKFLINFSQRQFESLVLFVVACAFWYASPIRDGLIWLIGFIIPVLVIRWLVHHRLWSATPMDEFLIGFVLLCLINFSTAPYETRGMILIFRPLLGILLYTSLAERAKTQQHIRGHLLVTIAGSILLGIVALTATDWSEGKRVFAPIIRHLPVISTYPGVEGLFNPNEIAGAMVWLAPLGFGLALYYYQSQKRLTALLTGIGALLLVIALLFGQSFSALAGLVIGLIVALIPRRFWVGVTGIIIAAVLLVQLMILVNPTLSVDIAATFSGRENLTSLEHREAMWIAARQAILDYPITGLGAAVFRSPVVWEDYPTPGFDRRLAVHAHNELLHIGTDLGIPGILMMLGWYFCAAYMLYYAWRRADAATQRLIMGIAGGLIAHMIYGQGDAIPLWDRFAFIFWWMLGLAAAQYTLARYHEPDLDKYSETPSRA